MDQTLNDLHAILDIPKDVIRPLRLHHPSFRDFFLARKRSEDLHLNIDEKQAHGTLATKCIQIMSTCFEQDRCGMGRPVALVGTCDTDRPGTLVSEVESHRIDEHLPPEMQYACVYWVQHLQRSEAQCHDGDQVHNFLKEHLLHWLEALGWIGKVPEGVRAIVSLESSASLSDCLDLSSFIYDAKRFVLYSRDATELAPLQTYCTALVFSPKTSMIRTQFAYYMPRWLRKLPMVREKWDAVLQTLEGHSETVCDMAFSPNCRILASTSFDRTVKLWEIESAALLYTLDGNSGYARAVTFSPNGQFLAVSADDRMITLRNALSGRLLRTLEGHLAPVGASSFSPNGRLLASASSDKTVKLWEVSSGVTLQTLEGHLKKVTDVLFSPNGKLLVSVSNDQTVKLWDVDTGEVQQTRKDRLSMGHTVAFSPDGRVLASELEDKTINIWDAGSGELVQTLEDHTRMISKVVFSQDNKLLASGSHDRTISLWDISSNAALQPGGPFRIR